MLEQANKGVTHGLGSEVPQKRVKETKKNEEEGLHHE